MTGTSDQGQTGAGQMGPNDTTSEFNAVIFSVRQLVNQLETMKPVVVKKVHGGDGAVAKGGTVDVQPLVSQVDGSANVVQHGVINGIPWFRLQGGGNAIIIDPKEGDFGFVVCSDRDISNVKTNPGVVPPGSNRKYSIADGIYIGGCFNDVPTQYITFTDDGIKLVDKNGNVIESKSSGIEITPASGGQVTINGNLRATGSIIAGYGTGDQIGLQSHRHPGNNLPPTPGT